MFVTVTLSAVVYASQSAKRHFQNQISQGKWGYIEISSTSDEHSTTWAAAEAETQVLGLMLRPLICVQSIYHSGREPVIFTVYQMKQLRSSVTGPLIAVSLSVGNLGSFQAARRWMLLGNMVGGRCCQRQRAYVNPHADGDIHTCTHVLVSCYECQVSSVMSVRSIGALALRVVCEFLFRGREKVGITIVIWFTLAFSKKWFCTGPVEINIGTLPFQT